MPDKLPKAYNPGVLTHEEAVFMTSAMSLAKAINQGDIGEQLVITLALQGFLSDREQADRMQAFFLRWAKMMWGDEKVDQVQKDLESEVSAKGYTKCPDCGEYHG